MHLSAAVAPYAYGLMGAGGLILVLVLVWWQSRRSLKRRLAAFVLRLGHSSLDVSGHRLETVVQRLETAAEESRLAATEAQGRASRLAGALDATGEAVLVRDEAGRLDYANPAAVGLLELAEELAGAGLPGLAHALAGTTEAALEMTLPRGAPRYLGLRRTGLDNGARDVGWVTVATDRSALRSLEQARQGLLERLRCQVRRPVGALDLLSRLLDQGAEGASRADTVAVAVRELDALVQTLEQLDDSYRGPISSSPPR